jgi:hypothetical protein
MFFRRTPVFEEADFRTSLGQSSIRGTVYLRTKIHLQGEKQRSYPIANGCNHSCHPIINNSVMYLRNSTGSKHRAVHAPTLIGGKMEAMIVQISATIDLLEA